MELLTYLLKVSACTVLFFGFYILVLRKLTFFKINRFYLLSTLLLSFLIPALQFNIERKADVNTHKQKVAVETKPSIVNNFKENDRQTLVSAVKKVSLSEILPIAYLTIASALLLLAVFRLSKLINLTRQQSTEINGLKILQKSSGFTNCSFFNYVFVGADHLSETELKILLTHERAHASQFHSADKLFLQFIKSVLWFNPVVYLFDNELELIHEYEADHITTQNLMVSDYAAVLLKMALSGNQTVVALTHNFVKNPVKDRIKMLFTIKAKKMKKVIYLASLPLFALLIWSFSFKYVDVLSKDNIQTQDSLRLVGGKNLSKNPKVTIDGRKYPAEILTKISPKSIKSSSIGKDKVDLITRDGKIKYATLAEIDNVKIQNELSENEFYLRFKQKHDDGEIYEVVKVTLAGASGAADIPKGGKVLFLLDGNEISETEFKKLNKNKVTSYHSISITETGKYMNENYPQYAGKYDAVIQMPYVPPVK